MYTLRLSELTEAMSDDIVQLTLCSCFGASPQKAIINFIRPKTSEAIVTFSKASCKCLHFYFIITVKNNNKIYYYRKKRAIKFTIIVKNNCKIYGTQAANLFIIRASS